MATGQRAFGGDTAAIVHDAIVNQTPPPAHEVNSTVPPKLEQIVNRAIEKDRELRYQSAADIDTDLQSLADRPRESDSGKFRVRSQWKWLTAAALICVAVVAGVLYWHSRRPTPLTERDTIVLADFKNTTGDAVFDDTLKRGLYIQLRQSPFLELLSDRKVERNLETDGASRG